ncbi:MAG TPA: glycosyltransferase family 4 protein [Planctomycetota bacterium]|nr:glycosyltransferase family 4 protein [Planctomycetota bacterium]
MPRKKRKWSTLNTVGVIGNYLPRRCGIATFTTDLTESISKASPETSCWAVVMNDTPEGYDYPSRVRFEINQAEPSDYLLAADFLNMNQLDVVCVQHEYGIFGGRAGSYLLDLLHDLRMPVVTTLHTVLRDPDPDQREVLQELADLSDRLVVMSDRAAEFLRQVYGVSAQRIAKIPHGIPDIPFMDPSYFKDKFAVAGRKVVLSFGLLGPGKGIEHMIDALPGVVAQHPDVVYLVLGATHPNIKKTSGEAYRLSLQMRAKELGVDAHVIFHNRFVELEELCEFLGAADIYVTSYLSEVQITSGTLAYALGAGKAVVSTPYWYAQEMLADGRGRLVPFGDAAALAREIVDLFDNETERHSMRKAAYDYCRRMVWSRVAGQYLDLFELSKRERLRQPRPNFRARTIGDVGMELPEVKLDHLRRLTDDTGILQHAKFTVPDRAEGYCTDDNARAIIAVMMAERLLPADASLSIMASRYLSFLDYAFDERTRRFRNFMTYDRRWLEKHGSEDSHGRSVWSLGIALSLSPSEGQTALTLSLFQQALSPVEEFGSPRAWAFALIGIHAYLKRFSGDTRVKRMRETLAGRLFEMFEHNADHAWPWLEDSLHYCNAKIPHALLLAGRALGRDDIIATALTALEWLVNLQTSPQGHFVPVGSDGWYVRGKTQARFDQQPIEAHAMIDACIEAFRVTGSTRWMECAQMCFDWFLGRNDLRLSLYDHATGGCRDGLQSEGVNQNQGAESTLAWLMSLLSMRAYLSGGQAPEGGPLKVEARRPHKDAAAVPVKSPEEAPAEEVPGAE